MSKGYKYIPGDPWARCERCGFVYRSSELKEEWTGLHVCRYDFDRRHPQELIKPPKDVQRTVMWNLNDDPESFVSVTFQDVVDDVPSGDFNSNNENI